MLFKRRARLIGGGPRWRRKERKPLLATGRIKGIGRVYAFVHGIPFRTTRRSLERANSYVQTLSGERVEVLVGCGGGAGVST